MILSRLKNILGSSGFKSKLIEENEDALYSPYPNKDVPSILSIESTNFDIILTNSNDYKLSYKLYLEKGRESDVKIELGKARFGEIKWIVEQKSSSCLGKLVLNVPKFIDSINLNTKSGNIDVESLLNRELNFTTESGDIVLTSSKFNGAILTTKSGDIDIKTAKDSYSIQADTKNGDIVCRPKSQLGGKYLICNSIDGDIIIS